MADDVGIVSFDDLHLQRGPPGIYELITEGTASGVTAGVVHA